MNYDLPKIQNFAEYLHRIADTSPSDDVSIDARRAELNLNHLVENARSEQMIRKYQH